MADDAQDMEGSGSVLTGGGHRDGPGSTSTDIPEYDAPLATRSLYDPEETDEEDLWFLPAEPEDRAPTDIPLPMAPAGQKSGGFGVEGWLSAEAGAGRALARATGAFSRFDERLKAFPVGAARIAVLCASAALEAQGDWIPSEKLALYLALREGTSDEAPEYRAADWMVRRLIGGLDPLEDLRGFLGRHATDYDGFDAVDLFGEPARGPEFEDLARDWLVLLEELGDRGMPDLVRAGVGFHMWRLSDISQPGSMVEAAVLASALGCRGVRHASYVPAMLGGRQDLLARGTPIERLTGWLKAVEDGCLRALLELERVQNWQGRAVGALADLSGRTPAMLISAFVVHPVVSAEMIAEESGASKAAVRRNLATFEGRGLVREVTGQERFRFWTLKA